MYCRKTSRSSSRKTPDTSERLLKMLPGYVAYGQDNQSLMYYKADCLRTCSECGYKIDFEYVNPETRIKKRIYDFSYTLDKCCIASAKLKKFCEEDNYRNIAFLQLPKDPDFYLFITKEKVSFDFQKAKTVFNKYCHTCKMYNEIGGAAPFLKNLNEPLKDGFFRSDILFGSGNERSPLIFVGEDTYKKIKRDKLKGFVFERIRE